MEPHGGRRETQPARLADPRRERIVDIERVARGGGEGEIAPRGPLGVGAGDSERVHEVAHHGASRAADAPQREGVARGGRARRTQAGERVRPDVGPAEIEWRARRGGVAHGQRRGDAPAIGQEALQAHGARHAGGVVGHIARILPELAELGAAPRQADGHVGHVRGRERDVHRRRGAHVLHHIAQADVVHPQLRLIDEDPAVHAQDARGDLLHGSEVRRSGGGVAHVGDVGTVAHHVGGIERHDRAVGTAGVDLRDVAAQPRLLDLGAQQEPTIQLHHHLRLPRGGARGSVVQIEIVLVLPRFDVRLEVAVLPPRAAAAHPDAQLPVLEEVLVPLPGESKERLGALSGLEAARQHAHRAFVDLGGRELQVRVAAPRFIEHAGRGCVPEVAVLRAHDRRDHLARPYAALAGDPPDGRLRALQPRCADQSHAREAEVDLRIGLARPGGVRRDQRDPHALDLTQVRRTDLDRVAAERDAVQAPAGGAVGKPVRERGEHGAITHVEALVADRKHEAHEVFRRPYAGDRVQPEVAVQVLGVDEAVMPPAARAQVAKEVGLERAVLGGAAERQRVLHRPRARIDDAIGNPVRQDAFVVDHRVPRVGDGIALGVESPQSHVALAVVGRIARRRRLEGLRYPSERVLEHRSEVDDQGRPVGLGNPVIVLPHPQLEVLGAREVDARRRQRLGDGAPARPVLMRAHPVGVAGVHVREPEHRVGLQHEPQDLLGGLGLADEPDRRIDLLWEELDGPPVGTEREVLPGEGRRVRRLKPRGRDAERLGAAHAGRNAAPVPAVLGQGEASPSFPFELLQVRLAHLVRSGTRRRELRRDVEQRRGIRVDPGERVERPGDEPRLEMQLGAHAADEARRRLEAEWRPRERALLLLEQTSEVHRAARSQVVAGRQPVDRGGRHGERRALFELGAHLGRAALEQRVRVLEGDLTRGVVDTVVGVAGQEPAPHVDLFRAVPDLETVERQLAAVARGGHAGVHSEGKHRRRRLGHEQEPRRAVQGVVALCGGEPGRVGERGEVREHREVVAQRPPLVGVARAGKQPVVLIEPRRIGLERHPEVGEVGVAAEHGALALVDGERERDRRPVDFAAADAVRAPDLEAERGRASRDPGPRVVHEAQRVDHRGVAAGGGRESADAPSAGGASDRAHRDVGDREVVALIEARGEREPHAARIDVVVLPLEQQLPLKRAGTLRVAVDRADRSRAARDRAHPADILVRGGGRGDGAHAVHAHAAHAEGIRE